METANQVGCFQRVLSREEVLKGSLIDELVSLRLIPMSGIAAMLFRFTCPIAKCVFSLLYKFMSHLQVREL